MATPNTGQHTWRFQENDNASVNSCSFKGGEGSTSETIQLDTPFIIRIARWNDSTANFSGAHTLYYSKNGGTWTAVTGSSANVRVYDGLPSDAEACSQLLSNYSTYTFDSDGSYDDVDGVVTSVSHPKSNFWEDAWCITLRSAEMSVTDYVEFKSVPDTGTTTTESSYAKITAVAGVQTGACTDGVKWADTPSAKAGLQASLTDGAKWADTPEAIKGTSSSLEDGIKWGDSASADLVIIESIEDGINWGDDSHSSKIDLVEKIVDKFTGTSLDINIWYEEEYATDSISQNDHLIFSDIGGILYSIYRYILRDSYIYFNINLDDVSLSTYTYAGVVLKSGASGNVEIDYYREYPSGTETITGYWVDGGAPQQFFQISYSSTNHAWWRIRETNGTVYFETAPDSSGSPGVWTVQGSVTRSWTTFDLDYCKINFFMEAGTSSNAYFDNVNSPRSYGILEDGLIWGEDIDTVTYEQFGGDGVVWGDLAEADISGAETGDCTDGVIWGDLAEAEAEIEISLSDGIKWGDDAEGEAGNLVSLMDGVKWGDSVVTQQSLVTSLTDGIYWGDETEGVTSGANLGECTSGVVWGEDIDTVTYEQFGGDGIKWGDSAEGDVVGIESGECTDGTVWGDSVSEHVTSWHVSLSDGWMWGENFDLVISETFPDEGILWGDLAEANLGNFVSLTDGVKWGDAVSPSVSIIVGISDGVKWGDLTEYQTGNQVSLTDGIKWGDTISLNEGRVVYPVDGTKWGDSAEVSQYLLVSLTDGIKWGDQAVVEVGNVVSVSDGINWGDSISATIELLAAIIDGWKLGDSASAESANAASVTDGIVWGDLPIGETGNEFSGTASDGVKWGDLVDPVQIRRDGLSDGWTFGELVELQVDYVVSQTDGYVWGDNTVGSLGDIYLESQSDGWVWSDETFYPTILGLLFMDAYLSHRVSMKASLDERLEMDEVEVDHVLSMNVRLNNG